MSSVIPEKSFFGHSLNALETNQNPETVMTYLNSHLVDYVIRLRVSANVSPAYLRQIPVIFGKLPTIAVFTGSSHVSDEKGSWKAIANLNRSLGDILGLSKGEQLHILEAFPLQWQKRPDFMAFLKHECLK